MKDYNRLNKIELEFMMQHADNFHEAMKILMDKVNGPKLEDPKYFELLSKINKIKERLDKLQDFVENKSGGY